MTTATQTIKQEIPAGSYVVDPVHSSIGFAVTHAGVSTFRGSFAEYEARLTGGESPQLEGSVDVNSIEIADEQLKGHLLSPEFFDAGQYPRLSFESSELSVDEDGSGEGARHARDRRPEPRGRGDRALRASTSTTSTAAPGSGSRWRRRSTAATSASTGRPSCPAAATRSTGRSRSRSSWSWSRRASSDAGARDLGQPAPRLAEHALLRAAAERLPAGVELVEFERLAEIPPYDEDVDELEASRPDAVRELREAILAADAVLIATPEYNHSIPGQLKNALDWASRPAGESALNGKPAAAIGASKSMFGGVWAQAELRKVLGAMGGRVIEAELRSPTPHELLDGDRLSSSRSSRSGWRRSSTSWSRRPRSSPGSFTA